MRPRRAATPVADGDHRRTPRSPEKRRVRPTAAGGEDGDGYTRCCDALAARRRASTDAAAPPEPPSPRHRSGPAQSSPRHARARDELRARREEIARMEERALREAESLEVQRADLERRTQALEDRERNLDQRARGAEAGQAGPAARAGADLRAQRRPGQAAPDRRGRAGGPPPGGAAAAADRGGDQARGRAPRRNILSVAMQRLAAKHASEIDDSPGRAAQRRDEGPDHRPRRAQHPRAGEAHRRRRDHRRDALGGGAVELRRRSPRDRPDHARAADRRRADPPGPDRGDLRAGATEIDERIVEEGERAALEARVDGLDPELVRAAGPAPVPHQLRAERARPPGRVLAPRRR